MKTTETMAGKTVKVTRTFAATPERVFDAWLNPEIARRFLFATPTGEMVRVDIDARVGGRFLIVRRTDGDDVEHVGEYLAIDRPRRLVFTFAVPKYSAVYTQVSIEIVSAGTGSKVTLTHEGVLPEWADRTQEGWEMILDSLHRKLQDYASVTAPGEVRIERVLPGPMERVWEFLTDSEKRGRWLATGPIEPHVGGKVTFHFLNAKLSPHYAPPPEKYREHEKGSSMTGEVLEWQPPTRLRFTWSEPNNLHSEATFELSARGEDVLLVITHQRLSNRAAMVGVGAGWHTHLSILDDVLRGQTPAAFWNTFNPLEAEYEQRIPTDAERSAGEGRLTKP
ncbi:MAG TPA: SRPBCC domain-containing protein [Acidobacteriaceae bacterium]